MFLRFLLLASVILFLSCADDDFNNPDDPKSDNYIGNISSSDNWYYSSSYYRYSSSSYYYYYSSSYYYYYSSSSSYKASSSSLALSSSSIGIVSGPSVTYEGEVYKTVKIGTQTWFRRNLNYYTGGSYCYDDDETNCEIYGQLYDWETAMDVCPTGWHLPTKAEWETLASYIKTNKKCTTNCDALYLKATSGWEYSGNGLDSYGFAALPGGLSSDYDFSYIGYTGFFWSASETDDDYAYNLEISNSYNYTSFSSYDKNSLLSVRCLQNTASSSSSVTKSSSSSVTKSSSSSAQKSSSSSVQKSSSSSEPPPEESSSSAQKSSSSSEPPPEESSSSSEPLEDEES